MENRLSVKTGGFAISLRSNCQKVCT
jgi:hypothetical protein